MTPIAVLAGAILPEGSPKPEWLKGKGQTKGSPALHQCTLVVLVHPDRLSLRYAAAMPCSIIVILDILATGHLLWRVNGCRLAGLPFLWTS